MSLTNKIKMAAALAASEAATHERARILWLLDEGEKELRQGFEQKLLLESERHAAQVKYGIACALHASLRMRIASGVHPCNICKAPTPPARVTCEKCMLTQRSPNGQEEGS